MKIRISENQYKLIKESEEKENLIKLLKSHDINNVNVGLELYRSLDFNIPKHIVDTALVNSLIHKYNWDSDVIREIVRDILDDPDEFYTLDGIDEYIDVILEWINDNEWDIEEWFEDVNDTYN